jgi:imidazolonepropionase-like amidohydrolase
VTRERQAAGARRLLDGGQDFVADIFGNGLVFAHVSLFDAPSGEILKDQSVVVIGNRIRGVGPSKQVALPAGAEVIDGRGKTLAWATFKSKSTVR